MFKLLLPLLLLISSNVFAGDYRTRHIDAINASIEYNQLAVKQAKVQLQYARTSQGRIQARNHLRQMEQHLERNQLELKLAKKQYNIK